MSIHSLSDNFRSLFWNLNPSDVKVSAAASEHSRITALIENPSSPASELSARCFLQGSYKQATAIHDINDVDIVALCELWQPGSGSASLGTKSYGRDAIFSLIAAAVSVDPRYRGKIRYTADSMCVKVEASTYIEILPVVYEAETTDYNTEPFRLYRPSTGQWEDGFARYHQWYLTSKNSQERTGGNFIPAIKIIKHLRTRYGLGSVSFHIECLLYSLPDAVFIGSPSDYIPKLLTALTLVTPEAWYRKAVMTPCGDRDIFVGKEWGIANWTAFHDMMSTLATLAGIAANTTSRDNAISTWQTIFGDEYFPHL
jgi:hypothetical protein